MYRKTLPTVVLLLCVPTVGAAGLAPQIKGVDLDGKPFKLSDYRGKVVLLDFWESL